MTTRPQETSNTEEFYLILLQQNHSTLTHLSYSEGAYSIKAIIFVIVCTYSDYVSICFIMDSSAILENYINPYVRVCHTQSPNCIA